jgi:hypothetical protein
MSAEYGRDSRGPPFNIFGHQCSDQLWSIHLPASSLAAGGKSGKTWKDGSGRRNSAEARDQITFFRQAGSGGASPMKNRLILWLVLLLIGFLAGFIPQYIKAQRAVSELSSAKQQLSSCQLANRLAQLRDTAALMFLEATRKNYGIAGEHSRRFFEEGQQIAAQTTDAGLRTSLQQLLNSHDAITAQLAKGDPAVVTELETLLMKAEHDLKR